MNVFANGPRVIAVDYGTEPARSDTQRIEAKVLTVLPLDKEL